MPGPRCLRFVFTDVQSSWRGHKGTVKSIQICRPTRRALLFFCWSILRYGSLQLGTRMKCQRACGVALIVVCVTLDRDTQTLLKCVKQSCTICDIIFSPENPQSSVSNRSLQRNVREVVGKPAEIRPIRGPVCC